MSTTARIKSELWKLQTQFRNNAQQKRVTVESAIEQLKSFEVELCPKTSPGEQTSLHYKKTLQST